MAISGSPSMIRTSAAIWCAGAGASSSTAIVLFVASLV
jgi:hypothetical protein